MHKAGKEGGRGGYSFAFSEFETVECAAAALQCLNGYQYDPEEPKLGAMQLRYAKPERPARGAGGGMGPNRMASEQRQSGPMQDLRGQRSPGGGGGGGDGGRGGGSASGGGRGGGGGGGPSRGGREGPAGVPKLQPAGFVARDRLQVRGPGAQQQEGRPRSMPPPQHGPQFRGGGPGQPPYSRR